VRSHSSEQIEYVYNVWVFVAVVPVYKMNLIRLDRYIGSYMITVMVSEILTFLYIIYFFYREIKTFRASKGKYFKASPNVY